MVKENKKIGTVNGRITVFNGKFKTCKGEKDATFRYGHNIPLDTPTNFSAGYVGSAIHDLSEKYLKGDSK